MGCISHAARRLVLIIPTLLGASGLMFVLTILIPGDPALVRLGNFATAEQLQRLREEMGLTQPPYTRYALYLSSLLRGDMGRSWRTGNLVLDDLRARLPVSLELGVCSMLLAIAVGIPVGVWGAASKDSQNSLLDRQCFAVEVLLTIRVWKSCCTCGIISFDLEVIADLLWRMGGESSPVSLKVPWLPTPRLRSMPVPLVSHGFWSH